MTWVKVVEISEEDTWFKERGVILGYEGEANLKKWDDGWQYGTVGKYNFFKVKTRQCKRPRGVRS